MSRKKINRWIAVIAAAAAAMSGLSGCQGKTEQSAEEKTEVKAEESGEFIPALDTEAEGTLEIAGFMGNFEALDQVVNDFNEYYPGISISYEQNSSQQLTEYLKNNAYVDIFMTAEGNFSYPDNEDMYAVDYCLDLSKEDIDFSAIQDEEIQAGTVDGKLLRLPIMQNTFGMVVNKTLLQDEGLDVPSDYEEFKEVLEDLKQKGYVPIQGSHVHVYSEIAANMALSQIGTDDELRGKLEDGDGSAAAELKPVYERLYEIIQNGYTDYSLNETYPTDNYDQAILNFFEGDVPFWICSAECVSGMKKRESKSETFTQKPFEYQFLYVPVGEEGAYEYREPWYGFSVNKDSDNKEYAVEFMRFLATEDEINQMASVKGMPSVAKNSADDRYAGIQNSDNVERSYIDDGQISSSVKSNVADVSNQMGSGAYASVEEALQDLERRCSEKEN